jgi:chaperonin GroEL
MKEIKTGESMISSLKRGIDTAVNLAKSTLGGKGKLVMVDTPGKFNWTMDGVTVLRNTAMKDKTEDMGVKVVLEVAEKQVKECGDGTTSVSVLLQAIINSGLRNIAAGADPLKVREGISMAAHKVITYLENTAKKIERDDKEVFQIAKVSAHGDEDVANLIAEVVGKTTSNSVISIQESPSVETYIELTKGMKVGSGWLSHLFMTNTGKGIAEYENPLVLIYEGKIESLNPIMPFLSQAKDTGRGIVIVSDKMDGEALSSLAVNKAQGILKVAAINAFGFNSDDAKLRLEDLAVSLGCKVLSPDYGDKLEDITIDDCGTCARVVISQEYTVFEEGNSNDEELSSRVSDLEEQIESEDNAYKKELLRGRIASITGGIGTVYVGGVVGSDVQERIDRFEDALGAAQASLDGGIVPGGGVSLLLASKELDTFSCTHSGDVLTGVNILKEALTMPIHQILTNAGLKPDVIMNKINESDENLGYNVYTDKYVDMIKEGIVDPAKVEINVVRNASQVASNFLNTAGSIAIVPDEK